MTPSAARTRHGADQCDAVTEDLGDDRLAILRGASEVLAGQVEYVAVVAEPLMYLLLQVGSPVPCVGRNHDEVDVAVCVCISAGDGSEHDHGLDVRAASRTTRVSISIGLANERRGVMASWPSLMRCTPARPMVSVVISSDPIEVSEGLLNCAQAVAIDERVNAPSGQRRARAQQHREHRAAGSGHQAAEGLTEIHMTIIPFI